MNIKHCIIVGINTLHPSARLQISGILRYAAKHLDWDVQVLPGHPASQAWNDDPKWQPDGLILDEYHMLRDGPRFLKRPSVRAAVFMGCPPPPRLPVKTAEIVIDDRAIAARAAELFVGRGLRNFAFIGSCNNDSWSAARMRFFRAALKDRGFRTLVYKQPDDYSKDRSCLSRWLLSLPSPCGVFIALDERAKRVVDLCRSIGLKIPEQIQILGVDNDEILCENARPTISSIMPDFESHGYRAAETLAVLLKKGHSPCKIKTGVKEVVERMSTTNPTHSASRIERARDYIRSHVAKGICVGAVVKAVGGSQRLLELNFREVLNHSIQEEINLMRLSKVKKMLTTTSYSFDVIASFCGFHNTNHLRNIFKQRFGKTLSAYRKSAGR